MPLFMVLSFNSGCGNKQRNGDGHPIDSRIVTNIQLKSLWSLTQWLGE